MSTHKHLSCPTIPSPTCKSVKKVRQDVINVIDKMGCSTSASHHTINSELEHEESSSSQDLLSAIVQIRKVTSREARSPLQSAREDSQMTVYNISDITDNNGEQTDEAAVQTSVAVNINHKQPFMCPYMLHYQDNIVKHAPFERSNNVDHTTHVPFERSFGQTTKYIKQAAIDGRSRLANFLGIKCKGEDCRGQCDLYKINIEQAPDDKSPPRKLVFDLVDESAQKNTKTIGTNTNDKNADGIHTHNLENYVYNNENQFAKDSKATVKSKLPAERMDIYYFDHGNTEYFRTTDSPPVLMTEYLAERTEYYTKRFWAQLFGTIHIGVSFVTSFILQLIRFLLQALIRPLTVGVVQLFADYFLKPTLTVLFNGIIQPPMIFLYNIATSIRDVCEPIASGIGYFIREIAVLFKAMRLVQVDTGTKQQQHQQR